MTAIKPFRCLIVYPALLRTIERGRWRALRAVTHSDEHDDQDDDGNDDGNDR